MIRRWSDVEPVRLYTLAGAILAALVVAGIQISVENQNVLLNLVQAVIMIVFPYGGSAIAREKVAPLARFQPLED